jgi:hypothetical protein
MTSTPLRHAARFLLLVSFALLAACQPAASTLTPRPTPPPTSEPTGPIETLAAFYQWLSEFPGDPLAREAYRVNPVMQRFLTDGAVDEIEAALASSADYDPLTCSQNPPGSYTFDLTAMTAERASIVVHRWYGESLAPDMQVDLAANNGLWQIAAIDCLMDGQPVPLPTLLPTPAPGDPWQLYENHAYGFRLEIPATWTRVETPVPDNQGIDPIDAYVNFMENGERLPVALVISTGPLTDFRLVLPLPEGGPLEQRVVNGYGVRVEEHFEGETYTIIEHPVPGTMRVAIRVISRAGPIPSKEQDIVTHMLETFIYTGN